MIQVQVSKDYFYGNDTARDFTLSYPVPEPPMGMQYIYLIVSDEDGGNTL